MTNPAFHTTPNPAPTLQPCDARADQEAWENDTEPTNYRLKDDQSVVLLRSAKGDFSAGYFVVPKGTVGTVIRARTPRAVIKPNAVSQYFANVDVQIGGVKGRIRVPHSALRILPKKKLSA